MLNIPGYAGRNTTLLFYFLLVVQLSDVMQYVWGKLLGKRPIAPRDQPEQDLGRIPGRRDHGHRGWRGALPRDAVPALASRRDVRNHHVDGLRRRPDDVGDQTRLWRKGFRRDHPGPWRHPRPHRLVVLLGAGFLPPDTPFLHMTRGQDSFRMSSNPQNRPK